MKHVSDEDIHSMTYGSPIRISDAASMLRRKVRNNDPPYTQTVVKKNNDRVDEWYNKVLKNIANSTGQISAGHVWTSWKIFEEGKNMLSYPKVSDHTVHAPQEEMDYWQDTLFNGSMEELHDLGTGAVAFGWNLIVTELKLWFADQKWDRVYSKSDDPLVWEREMGKNLRLFKGEEFPPWKWSQEMFKETAEKVQVLLSTTVEPKA